MVFNRQVDDIRVTQYVDPGVEDNSMARGLAAVGEGALRIDQKVGENALRNEFTAMESLYKSGSTAVTDKAPLSLTENDLSEIMSARDNLGKMQRAVAQGGISFDQYRLFAESSLRAAIARRPGLASEYRQIAADTLGTDVSGAAVDFLAAKETEMNRANAQRVSSAAEAEADNTKRLAEEIRKTLATTTLMGSDAWAVDSKDDVSLVEWVRTNPLARDIFNTARTTMRSREEAKLAAEITQDTQTAGAPAQQAEMTARVADAGATFSALGMSIQSKLADGISPEEATEIATTMRAGRDKLIQMRQELLSLSGSVTPEYFTAASKQLEEMEAALGMVITDQSEVTEQGLKLFVDQATLRATQSPQFSHNFIIAKAFGEAAAAEVIGALQAPQKAALAMVIQDATVKQAPDLLLSSGVDYVTGMITRLGTLKEQELTPDMRQMDANGLKRIIAAVRTVPNEKFISSQWSGPLGMLVRLSGRAGQQAHDYLPEPERKAIGGLMLDANLRSLDAIRSQWLAEGRPEAKFELREDGTFIQPVDPAQAVIARQYEGRTLNGKAMLDATSLFTGMGGDEVASYLNRTRPVPTVAPNVQANATDVPRNPAPTTATPPDAEVTSIADEINSVWKN